jgi:hypothetical protein
MVNPWHNRATPAAGQHSLVVRYGEPMADEWRRIIAALGNVDTRRSYAEVVLAIEPAPSKRGDRARTTLAAAGLIRQDSGGVWRPDDDALPALLATPSRPIAHGVDRFLKDGRIERFPAASAERLALLDWAVDTTLAPGDSFSERELNERLKRITADVALLRRYLVDERLLSRTPDGSTYRRGVDDHAVEPTLR